MIVPVRQRALKVLVYLLEPKADNSLVSWGYFNRSMERKEYAETYVMEKMAREMIAKDPNLLEEFMVWKKANPELSKNQWIQYTKDAWNDQNAVVHKIIRKWY